jgi:excisionase family DNA binding protein
MTEHVLTVEEAARLLRIGRGTAYEAVRAGTLPTVRIGRRILVPKARLMALLGEEVNSQEALEPARHPRERPGRDH